MPISEILTDMQLRGWTVTFPAFGNTRAMVVKATKGDQEWQRGFAPNSEGTFMDAMKRLALDTVQPGAK
jgi:hypothetical protein